MNPSQLELQIKGAIGSALQSKRTTVTDAVAILEMIKMDLFANMREAMKSAIIPAGPRIVPLPPLNGK